MKSAGILVSADLASDVSTKAYGELLKAWCSLMTGSEVSPEKLAQMRAGYEQHVAILPPNTVASIVEDGGFITPVQFFQAALIHAWHCQRTPRLAAR